MVGIGWLNAVIDPQWVIFLVLPQLVDLFLQLDGVLCGARTRCGSPQVVLKEYQSYVLSMGVSVCSNTLLNFDVIVRTGLWNAGTRSRSY